MNKMSLMFASKLLKTANGSCKICKNGNVWFGKGHPHPYTVFDIESPDIKKILVDSGYRISSGYEFWKGFTRFSMSLSGISMSGNAPYTTS